MGRDSMMKCCIVLLALAVVVTGHWTHDDALAREIGAPAGEADLDVSMLADEVVGRKLLQATIKGSDNIIKQEISANTAVLNQPVYSNKDGSYAKLLENADGDAIFKAQGIKADGKTENKVYRITIGTLADPECSGADKPGPANCQLQFKLTGEYSAGTSEVGKDNEQNWMPLRQYLGPTALSYGDALANAAPLHPGMMAVLTDAVCKRFKPGDNFVGCAGPSTGMGSAPIVARQCEVDQNCASEPEFITNNGVQEENPDFGPPVDRCAPCEAMTKDCEQGIAKLASGFEPDGAGPWSETGVLGYRPVYFKKNKMNIPLTAGSNTPAESTQDGDFPSIIIQRGQIEQPDVGVIRKVQVGMKPDDSTVSVCGGWKGDFIKVDTNDIFSGVGNGIYYIPAADGAAHSSIELQNCSGEGDCSSDAKTLTFDVEQNQIARCMADSCEEEMDTRFGMA